MGKEGSILEALGLVGARRPGISEAEGLRRTLVEIVGREVTEPRVLDALRAVPRDLFVPEHTLSEAYGDHPLPIGHGATISQPTVVGMMSEALALAGHERILEIGTGSGYQAAVLARLAAEVHSVEIVPELVLRARAALERVGATNVHVHEGDGWRGWPEAGLYDRVVVTAAPDVLPEALFDQLASGGLLVVPVGPQSTDQRLERWRKVDGRLTKDDLGAVRFVPMVHSH